MFLSYSAFTQLVRFSHVNLNHTVCLHNHNQSTLSLHQSDHDTCRSLPFNGVFSQASPSLQQALMWYRGGVFLKNLHPLLLHRSHATPKAKDIWCLCNEELKGLQFPIRKHLLNSIIHCHDSAQKLHFLLQNNNTIQYVIPYLH